MNTVLNYLQALLIIIIIVPNAFSFHCSAVVLMQNNHDEYTSYLAYYVPVPVYTHPHCVNNEISSLLSLSSAFRVSSTGFLLFSTAAAAAADEHGMAGGDDDGGGIKGTMGRDWDSKVNASQLKGRGMHGMELGGMRRNGWIKIKNRITLLCNEWMGRMKD